jgi:pyruvate/2-oxoglutarate/acetoin dehydrogenase E1 component
MRVATKDVPIPYNTELMQEVIPTVEDLSKALQRLLNW